MFNKSRSLVFLEFDVQFLLHLEVLEFKRRSTIKFPVAESFSTWKSHTVSDSFEFQITNYLEPSNIILTASRRIQLLYLSMYKADLFLDFKKNNKIINVKSPKTQKRTTE